MNICDALLLLILFGVIFIAGIMMGLMVMSAHPSRRPPMAANLAEKIRRTGAEARDAMDQASDDFLKQVQEQTNHKPQEEEPHVQ